MRAQGVLSLKTEMQQTEEGCQVTWRLLVTRDSPDSIAYDYLPPNIATKCLNQIDLKSSFNLLAITANLLS